MMILEQGRSLIQYFCPYKKMLSGYFPVEKMLGLKKSYDQTSGNKNETGNIKKKSKDITLLTKVY